MKAIEEMTIHELRNRKDEVMADFWAVVARLQELERSGLGVDALPYADPKPEKLPVLNAQPEGADIEDDAA